MSLEQMQRHGELARGGQMSDGSTEGTRLIIARLTGAVLVRKVSELYHESDAV